MSYFQALGLIYKEKMSMPILKDFGSQINFVCSGEKGDFLWFALNVIIFLSHQLNFLDYVSIVTKLQHNTC